ncbi:hypothetical protein LSTR_LSTR012046 [Laodelphax striatellus]|uniref:Uncharacterized protein n=1 Tax=Laodelphax striatellus TaxID=195883 RepID=A0A482WQL2_LAOST|nr:hypothetical protein LSTR_LSTR012046 [Laodelphax striatellus]
MGVSIIHFLQLGFLVISLQYSGVFPASLGDNIFEKGPRNPGNSSEVNDTMGVGGEGDTQAEIGNSELTNSTNECVHLCGIRYRCSSDEIALFELNLKADKCVQVCGTNLNCVGSSVEATTSNARPPLVAEAPRGIVTRNFKCSENQRLDKNGNCRDRKKP